MRRVKIVDGDRVGGYGYFGNPDYPIYDWPDAPVKLKDEYGRLKYRWDGEKPVHDPIKPSDEEVAAKKKSRRHQTDCSRISQPA